MKTLNKKEVALLAENLNMTNKQAEEVAEIFVKMYDEKLWNAPEKLDSLEDYIYEWENSWFRYRTIEDLVKSENDQGVYNEEYYTVDNAIAELDKSIFKLKNDLYIQCYK